MLQIAAAEGISFDWLKDGEGAMIAEDKSSALEVPIIKLAGSGASNDAELVPVFATKELGATLMLLTERAIDYAARPSVLRYVTEAFGINVSSNSMEPAIRAGDVAWINPLLPPARNKNVLLCRPDDSGGEVGMIAILVDYDRDNWTVETINPERNRVALPRKTWTKCLRIAAVHYN
jgi:phage repressor protein C with HTH and peptisase S24 domain